MWVCSIKLLKRCSSWLYFDLTQSILTRKCSRLPPLSEVCTHSTLTLTLTLTRKCSKLPSLAEVCTHSTLTLTLTRKCSRLPPLAEVCTHSTLTLTLNTHTQMLQAATTGWCVQSLWPASRRHPLLGPLPLDGPLPHPSTTPSPMSASWRGH